jgi:hypothetical protein
MSDETYCRGVISITEFICNLNELVFKFQIRAQGLSTIGHLMLAGLLLFGFR